MTRIGISTRVFGLAAALGLAASGKAVPEVGGSFLLLCAIAALASVPQPTDTAQRMVPIIEGALVGLTLAIGGLVSQPLGLYLVVPALMAGLLGGPVIIAVTLCAEVATMAAVPFVSQQPGTLPTMLREALPWVLTGIGMGLLGSWIRRLKSVPIDEDQARYVVAHRLLDELRVVSRRLSSGLDAVLLSTTLLGDCLARVTDGRGAVLVRTDGGVFVSLAQHLGDVTGDVADDPLVMQCWTTAVPAQQAAIQDRHPRAVPDATGARDPGSTTGRTRWALPVRVGTRMVGVLALDVGQPLDAGLLIELQALLNERALPLDAALLFDEVRAIATVEERHRLAREIHDGVAQEIASLGYLVDDLAFSPDEVLAAGLAHLRAELTRIVDDLRLSIFDLRSQVSRTTGLGSVLAEYLREVGSRSGTAVHLTLDETPDRLRLEIEEQLLRMVQEAVTNARKHSGADNLWVSCRVRPPAASLVIEDDGSGVAGVGGADGFGLSIMRERAQRIGATLTITARASGGTRVTIRLHAPRDTGLLAHDEPAATRPPLTLAHSTSRAVAHG